MPTINRISLTNRICKRWAPPSPKSEGWRWDSEAVGLGVRVKPLKGKSKTRCRSFVYHGTLRAPHPRAGKYTRFSLGTVGRLSLDAARKLTAECNLLLLDGKDPKERFKNRPTLLTVRDLAVKMMTEHHGTTWEEESRKETNESKHARKQRHYWQRFVVPNIGDLPLKDVEASDINAVTKIAAETGKPTARQVRACMKAGFNKALEWKLFKGVNPVLASKKYPSQRRTQVLTQDELLTLIVEGEKHLLEVIEGQGRDRLMNIRQLVAILMGPETVRRPNELFRLEWDWIDMEKRLVHLPRAKGDRDNSEEHKGQMFAFSKRGRALLQIAKTFSGDSRYVFPSPHTDSGHLMAIYNMWNKLKRRAGVTCEATAYTFKHAVVSLSTDAGVGLLAIQKACGHSDPKTTEIYFRSGDRRRANTTEQLSTYMQEQRGETGVDLGALAMREDDSLAA